MLRPVFPSAYSRRKLPSNTFVRGKFAQREGIGSHTLIPQGSQSRRQGAMNGSWVQGSSQVHEASFSASHFIPILRAFSSYSVLHLCSASQLCSVFNICLFIAMPCPPCYHNSVLRWVLWQADERRHGLTYKSMRAPAGILLHRSTSCVHRVLGSWLIQIHFHSSVSSLPGSRFLAGGLARVRGSLLSIPLLRKDTVIIVIIMLMQA